VWGFRGGYVYLQGCSPALLMAVRFLTPRFKDPAKQLVMSKPLAEELSLSASSPEFWDQARAPKTILCHVMDFSGLAIRCA